MYTTLVLTVIGPDRPGIVDALSAVIVAHGGGWHRSRMAQLAGQFAGILEVQVPPASQADLCAALGDLRERDLTVSVTRTTPPATGAHPRALMIDLVGHDRPGIIQAVAHALANRGVNVADLRSNTVRAPMSGTPMFEAHALVHLPPVVAIDELRVALEALATDMMVDLSFEAPA
ncbi:MAG: glycine cleavage system protein R [Proteobacteria bacterium]|nr:MAG: glycine cleavage system protein R [Pseudomonadota bacterium]